MYCFPLKKKKKKRDAKSSSVIDIVVSIKNLLQVEIINLSVLFKWQV